MKIVFKLFLMTLLFIGCTQQNDTFTLDSPDKSLSVEISLKANETNPDSSNHLVYSIIFNNQTIIIHSPLFLTFKDMPPIGTGLIVTGSDRKNNNTIWERVWGKRKTVRNNYNQLIVTLTEKSSPFRKIDWVFRAYNDGIAFRYRIPEQKMIKNFELTAENTCFNFTDDHQIWAVNYGGYASHQEGIFNKITLSKIEGKIIGLPLVIKISDRVYMAITEAELTDWSGMYLSNSNQTKNALVTKLSPRTDDPEILVRSDLPCRSPWRVLMIGDTPANLIQSDLIANLNDPCAIDDISWIKPGKSAWDWWWCNRYAPDVDFTLGANTETMKYFIDFAAEMGWQYQLVDWYWYDPPFIEPIDWSNPISNPDADITTMNPTISIPELVRYAKERNIRLFLWLEWHHAQKQMEEAFPLYEKWGIAGVKVDFMARDDQEIVHFYHRLVKLAAKHHLLVDFHGAYKPTGFSRTYPNLITREGVLGNEYTKWSDQVTPEHKVTLPFTRGILGEMDFTPGSFINVSKKNFKTESNGQSPMSMGTRCNQLALMVVYESAFQVLCDSPYNYRNSPDGLDFLKIVPTTWDDTKVLNADIGNFITIARRSGEEWFVGSMTDWDERQLQIPLDFLVPQKTYSAKIWQDGEDANINPTSLTITEISVNSKTIISAKLAKGGGQIIHLSLVD